MLSFNKQTSDTNCVSEPAKPHSSHIERWQEVEVIAALRWVLSTLVRKRGGAVQPCRIWHVSKNAGFRHYSTCRILRPLAGVYFRAASSQLPQQISDKLQCGV